MTSIDGIYLYPIKGLSGLSVDKSIILPGGTLAFDRRFALVDDAGAVVNGKRTPRVHAVDISYQLHEDVIDVSAPGFESSRFNLRTEADVAADWFSEYFEMKLSLVRDEELGYVDRRELGPSVISRGTLDTLAGWFPEITTEEMRRRLRPNIVLTPEEPFWEDGLLVPDNGGFRAGGIRFEAAAPCGRCVVPERDSASGERTPDFRERFIEFRRETLPEWVPDSVLEHLYTVMIITSVPTADRGRSIRVGDSVRVSDEDHPIGLPD